MNQKQDITRQKAIKFVQKLLSEFDKEILEVFYKQNRFHNNEITKLKEKIAHHKLKLEENGQREREFRWFSEQAKDSVEEPSTKIVQQGQGIYDLKLL